MEHIKRVFGYALAGLLVMSVWGELGNVGVYGGYVAALVIIGPMWFLNHYLNTSGNHEGVSFVDMGLAIGVSGLARDAFLTDQQNLFAAWPTFLLVVIGALIGGSLAALFAKHQKKEAKANDL
ncbi:Lin0368 family putative glycerol transporter subunit [Vagococcus salmoninarum]|uniref:Lin0368 family putative glycerol transporter subunit n=1 Tax=Vagococcus salmoninarum TaxID=2739 RepID=UPI0028D62C4F|nr:hypothetical protein [Vagococcus salmoninarum]